MNPVAAVRINAPSVPENSDGFFMYWIDYFLRKYSKGVSNVPKLASLLRGKLGDLKDPPLDIIWFYAAVEFHSFQSSDVPPPGKFLIAKDLFQLLKFCTSQCSEVKKVAVLAPVLYLLYNLDLNFSAKDPCLRQDISALVEEIFIYLSSCSELLVEGEESLADLGVHILWLIRFWGVDQVRDNPDTYFMDTFFPILNGELRQEVTLCLGNMAGLVFNETLLLRLRLCQGTNKEGYLHTDVLKLAIQTIKSFQNIYFLDLLYKMLSEPKLPATASLSQEDAIILNKALYDAVMLFDYSFYSGIWIKSLDSRTKRLAILWVLVANSAFRFSRSIADLPRLSTYRRAFLASQLVAELVRWATSEDEVIQENARPPKLTPQSLMNWLLVLEDQGVRVSDSGTTLIHTKAVMSCLSSADRSQWFLKNNTVEGGCRKRKEAMLSSELENSRFLTKQLRRNLPGVRRELVISMLSDHEDDDSEDGDYEDDYNVLEIV